ncbi:BadF/BadG/BcrA/BcrD ATPase family protein [Glaciihabitans sp. UYNi722]|uniref:N-acetylglucosamine kinase n=1 Tax=Glaciihabitans sp. UYNi722 TaxID=3156344 RepID=UPI003390C68E
MGTVTSGGIVAVDGGGSKTDAVAVDLDGHVLAHARGPASNPQTQGLAPAVAVVDALIAEVLEATARPLAKVGVFLAGLDLEAEVTAFRAAVADLPWASAGTVVFDNDMLALLRSGTTEANAVAVVCGTGINAIGVRADGTTARFPAVGLISGDWGGGSQLGEQALWYAARAVDGRGDPTVFTGTVPSHFDLPDVRAVTEAFHFGRLPYSALATLSPVVLEAADGGDAVALGILDRQAQEIVALARAAITRLDLLDTPVPVVLGGGVLAAGNARLLSLVENGLAEVAPLAHISLVRERPIVGAALLTLEAAGASAEHEDAARAALASTFAQLDEVRA